MRSIPVDEHGARDALGVVRREVQRHHGSPRMTDDEGALERGCTDHAEGVRRDVVEPVAMVRLPAEAVTASVECHDTESAREPSHHQTPDVLRRREAVVQEQSG